MADKPPLLAYAENRFSRSPTILGPTPEVEGEPSGISGQVPPPANYLAQMAQASNDPQVKAFLQSNVPQNLGVHLVNPDPDPAKNSRLMRHEAVHNILDSSGVDLSGFENSSPLAQKLKQSFAASSQAGQSAAEVPAYMVAFYHGDVPGVLRTDRDAYANQLQDYLQKANPVAAAKIAHISAIMPIDPHETKLSPHDEAAYQSWKSQHAPNDSGEDYDIRGLFKSGQGTDARGHATDQFKKPNHPTFSVESQYSTPQNPGGQWLNRDGKSFFVPTQANLTGRSFKELQDYFTKYEPGTTLMPPAAPPPVANALAKLSNDQAAAPTVSPFARLAKLLGF